MTNWRTVLNIPERPHSLTHNVQNPQNRKAEVDSEYFDQYGDSSNTSEEVTSPDIPQRAPDIPDTVLSVSASSGPVGKDSVNIHVGDQITWLSVDGKPRGPVSIDFVHTDPDGSTWCFVTLPDGWAAVNAKYVTALRTFWNRGGKNAVSTGTIENGRTKNRHHQPIHRHYERSGAGGL